MKSTQKTAIIIGAGPAGLTAAIELLKHSDIKPIVLEASEFVGGISRTIRFNDNRMDIGGHRFFSKSDEIINWWLEILPLEKNAEINQGISYQNKHRTLNVESVDDKQDSENVMLIRKRKSRILYDKKFFDYPITLSVRTLSNLGFIKIVKIGCSYIWSRLFPIRKEKNLEDFFINRFGKELYLTFFKSYTEKVWGKKCTDIGVDWGRQRIKGLSVSKTITDAISRIFRKKSIDQKDVETSLIEYFMYPKYGPGHMWENVAQKVKEQGGEIIMNSRVTKLKYQNNKVISATYTTVDTGEEIELEAGYFLSTMPIDKVFMGFEGDNIADDVRNIATSLEYRNFITVGVLISSEHLNGVTDNWIYIHEPDVYVGRVQFFHNWSESMVAKKENHLLGLEYFCDEGDYLWNLPEEEFKILAGEELVKIGLVKDIEHALDFRVEKIEKAYPVYAGSYDQFEKVKNHLDSIENFYPIGRNGMHRYNNQDHSMLTAMSAVQSIIGNYDKKDIWNINADQEYHEKK